MADWFDFKGVRSTSLGVIVMEFPPITLPEERAEFKTPIGRSGSLTILEGEGVYNDVLLPINCFINDMSRLNSISSWLKGSGGLILGNMPNFYYIARIVNQIDLRKIIRETEHRTLPIIFRCSPYRYRYPAIAPTEYLNGSTITNPGNVPSQPVYTITGSGDISLSIGDKTIIITGLVESITIDVELGLAYKTNSDPLIPLTGILGHEDWPFTISPGANAITWTGNVTQLKIEPRWRDV